MRKLLLTTAALLGFSITQALAICTGPAGQPFNCTKSVIAPQPNDLVYGGATSGQQNGQSLTWTWGQVFTGTTLTSPLIINGTIQSLNTPLAGLYGGTGVANSGDTITLGGDFTTSGVFPLTLTLTAATNITLPTSGTILGTVLSSAEIYVGNASNVATAVPLSGDAALSNAGALTVSKIGGATAYAGHGLIGIQTFCASGCTHTGGTYTADTGTNQVIFEVEAPGGGSGGCPSTTSTQSCVSGSGSAGSYAKVLYTSGFSGITLTPGASGAAGASGANAGGTGGTTSAGSLVSCPGGIGGAAGSASTIVAWTAAVGSAAAPSACTVVGGIVLSSIVGQPSGYGFAALNSTGSQYPGPGGNSAMGFGVPLIGNGSASFTGAAGTGYGWGAGGAINALSQSAITGLAGGTSRIIVEEFN